MEASLALAPGYTEPLAQHVLMDFAAKRPDLALDRVKKQTALAPTSGPLYLLLARTHAARGELAPAEAADPKAIELEPRLAGPYLELGGL